MYTCLWKWHVYMSTQPQFPFNNLCVYFHTCFTWPHVSVEPVHPHMVSHTVIISNTYLHKVSLTHTNTIMVLHTCPSKVQHPHMVSHPVCHPHIVLYTPHTWSHTQSVTPTLSCIHHTHGLTPSLSPPHCLVYTTHMVSHPVCHPHIVLYTPHTWSHTQSVTPTLSCIHHTHGLTPSLSHPHCLVYTTHMVSHPHMVSGFSCQHTHTHTHTYTHTHTQKATNNISWFYCSNKLDNQKECTYCCEARDTKLYFKWQTILALCVAHRIVVTTSIHAALNIDLKIDRYTCGINNKCKLTYCVLFSSSTKKTVYFILHWWHFTWHTKQISAETAVSKKTEADTAQNVFLFFVLNHTWNCHRLEPSSKTPKEPLSCRWSSQHDSCTN